MSDVRKTGVVIVDPHEHVRLGRIDPGDTGSYQHEDDATGRLEVLHAKLLKLQTSLYAEQKRSVLIVLQAMDTGGKDGATKALLAGINPTGIVVNTFKAPTPLELAHDFLWRVHPKVPAKGDIGLWNRSHYEDVLVVRVHKLITHKTVQERYEHINNFEKMLTDSGVTVLKFFLHISKDEQKKRLKARLNDPDKVWKFNPGDLAERKYWENYQAAYQDVFNNCSSKAAPWHIVPSNHKWARDIAIAEVVVAALKKLKPDYPSPSFDPKKIKID